MNEEQRDILRHALGLGRGNREYRNHFVTGPGSTDYPHCEALVSAGLMSRFPPNNLTGGDDCFVVTAAGRLAARGKAQPAVTITVTTPDGAEIASWQRDAHGRLIAEPAEGHGVLDGSNRTTSGAIGQP